MRVRIGSIWIDAVTLEGALATVDRLCAAGRGGVVVTPNVDHVVLAEGNAALREAYAAADLSLADGQWVVWAARALGTPLPERVAGSDLVLPLARAAAAAGRSMYLLGGAPGAAEEAAKRLRADTGVEVRGADAPRIDLANPDPALIERIRKARPDLLLVALGCPKQEIWMHRHREALRPAVMLGVGATLEFLAGRIPRAPRWMAKAGLEWFFRLSREPRRLARRYLVHDTRFLPILLATWREPRSRRVA